MSPEVTIIIPHFNRISLLKYTIQSVLDQTYSDWEIIIVDDGSNEREINALQSYKFNHKIQVIHRTTGIKGPSSCRNLGASLAKGKYLLFLDSDDILAPHCLEQRVHAMETSAANMGIFLMEEFHNEPRDSDKIFNDTKVNVDDLGLFIQNDNSWNVTCPLWKKDFFLSLNGFNEELLYMEDPEIHIQALLSEGVKIKKFYHLPADSYYRINHIDDTKKDFYYNSIYYRIKFLKHCWNLLSKKQHIKYVPAFRKGILNLFHTFLFSRINNHKNLFIELMDWLKNKNIFSRNELKFIQFGGFIFGLDSSVIHFFRMKGIYKKILLYSVR